MGGTMYVRACVCFVCVCGFQCVVCVCVSVYVSGYITGVFRCLGSAGIMVQLSVVSYFVFPFLSVGCIELFNRMCVCLSAHASIYTFASTSDANMSPVVSHKRSGCMWNLGQQRKLRCRLKRYVLLRILHFGMNNSRPLAPRILWSNVCKL